MTAKDRPVSQPANDKYREGWEQIQWKVPVTPVPVKEMEKKHDKS